jgi:ribosomal protein L29
MQHKELGPEAMAAKIAALEAELAELRSAAA